VNLESLLAKLSSDPERVKFAREQRDLLDASEAKDTAALADRAASMKKAAPTGPTMTKAEANYVGGPVANEPCGECSMFVWSLPTKIASGASHGCTLVAGDISARGHCDHWEEKM
jgi:hypothetical protein